MKTSSSKRRQLAPAVHEIAGKSRSHRMRCAIFTAGLTACLSPLSNAQMLEEVIVTAQKREQSANDIGMAISAFRGDELETLGIRDTRDLAHIVPGLTMATTSGGTPIYTMRGIGFNTPNMSSTSPVGVYIDEVSFHSSVGQSIRLIIGGCVGEIVVSQKFIVES